MKRIAALVILLAVPFACLCGLFWLLQFRLFNGCIVGGCAPPRAFEVTDLPLPASIFPPDATMGDMSEVSAEGELGVVQVGSQTIFWGRNWLNAGYEVIRYRDTGWASNGFATHKGLLSTPETFVPWQRPAALVFQSGTADEFHIACGVWSIYACAMVARYEEYVLRFRADIDSEMTEQRFEDIVRHIDSQISGRLDAP